VLLSALLFTLILLFRTQIMTYDDPNFPKPWDHHKYIFMAQNSLFNFHIAPFCWRIGVPLLVKLLPFDIIVNFLIISFTGIWFTGVVVYYAARELFLTKTYAISAMLMFFSLGWATKWILFDFWLPDAVSFLIITTAIYCIITKKDIYFFLLLYLGVLVKESIIFIVPLYYAFNTDRFFDIKQIRKLFLFTVPAVLILLGVRFLIPQMNSNADYLHKLAGYMPLNDSDKVVYNYWQLIWDTLKTRLHNLSYGSLIDYFVRPYGVFLVLASVYSFWYNKKYLVKFLPFILLIYLQLVFAINTERLLVFAFPALIIFAIDGLRTFTSITKTSPSAFILLLVLLYLANILSGFDQFTAHLQIQFLLCFTYITTLLLFKNRYFFIEKNNHND